MTARHNSTQRVNFSTRSGSSHCELAANLIHATVESRWRCVLGFTLHVCLIVLVSGQGGTISPTCFTRHASSQHDHTGVYKSSLTNLQISRTHVIKFQQDFYTDRASEVLQHGIQTNALSVMYDIIK